MDEHVAAAEAIASQELEDLLRPSPPPPAPATEAVAAASVAGAPAIPPAPAPVAPVAPDAAAPAPVPAADPGPGPAEAVNAAESATLSAPGLDPVAGRPRRTARTLTADTLLVIAQLIDLPFAWLDGSSKQTIGIAAVMLFLTGLVLLVVAYMH
jgi:hypothetical protein